MKLHKLKKIVLNTKNHKDRIILAELYANLMIGNPEKVYGDIHFENKLISSFLFLIPHININIKSPSKSICHIISTPYLEGGHTRLCENLASMEGKNKNLLITRNTKINVLDRLKKHFTKISIISDENFIERIKKITTYLYNFKKIILHIHPDDILTIIAIGILKKIKKDLTVYFVNHADHIFSYGRSVTDLMFLISYRGYEIEHLNEDRSYALSFLGIPINTKEKPLFKNEIKTILIAGSSYKMKPNSSYSIQKEINKYFKSNNNLKLIVIGAKITDFWWWKIKLMYWPHIKIYDLLPYSNYIDILKKCDACIDTAPSTGGTAFAEMYLNGLRPLAIYSGVYGYTPLDCIRGNSLQESEKKGYILLDDIYDQLVLVHGKENVQHRYHDGLNFNCHGIPSSLCKLNNDLDMYISSKKKTISLGLIKDIIGLKEVKKIEKLNILINNISFLNSFSIYLSKTISLFLNTKK
ncbi:TPA: hypothetical protein ACF51P_003594 [Providencia rettgeri]